MELLELRLKKENYNKETYEKLTDVLDILEYKYVHGDNILVWANMNLKKLEESPDFGEINRIIGDAVSVLTLEGMRSAN